MKHLTRLESLDLLHELLPRDWYFAPNATQGFPLDPILNLISLSRLRIIRKRADVKQYEHLLSKLAAGGFKFLRILDLANVYLSVETLSHLLEAYTDLQLILPTVRDPVGYTEDIGEESPPEFPSTGKVKCSFCLLFYAGDPDDHAAVCLEHRKCPLDCGFVGKPTTILNHLPNCLLFTVHCFFCRTSVSRAEIQAHLEAHNRICSMVPRPTLSQPAFINGRKYHIRICKSCLQECPSLRSLMQHECPQTERKIFVIFDPSCWTLARFRLRSKGGK
jgi:hypothetical protein